MTETPEPPAADGKSGNLWSRRSRRGKILIVVVGAIVLLFILIGAFSDSDTETASDTQAAETAEAAETGEAAEETTPAATEDDDAPATEAEETQPATTEEAEETQPVTTEEAGEEPAPPPPPKPIVLRGQGSRVETAQIQEDGPLVVGGVHRGSANFVVQLVGGGLDELLINEIGNYQGEVAVAEVTAGSYRVAVTADGPWTLYLTQPQSNPQARTVPTTVSGRGSKVVQIRATEDLQPVVDATHRGQANFVVYLIGLGDVSGEQLVVNEIGNYSGQTLVDSMPEGTYLLEVMADGTWSVKFTP